MPLKGAADCKAGLELRRGVEWPDEAAVKIYTERKRV